jgi:hypothetical protein
VGDSVTSVTGTELTGAERESVWKMLNERVFNYEGYQAKVHRHLAVVALEPVKPRADGSVLSPYNCLCDGR